ncbi:methyltransferase [Kaistia soli DSM 19436]|uniref:Methyltransferase n=1 Tax=Kaistia soli DSM 19436 TaxID=1122133 RepID=A0A1M5FIY5_9HYPH|nr:isoprenylcysteine carboxylmethyltransferase family protein [Kaistia soli]SHF91379.1 methyltransferase [Kaistia soli DSM 19436]
MIMLWPYLLLGFVVIQRIIELAWSERNRRALMLRRGREIGAGHYPLFILLHGAWIGAMLLFVQPGIPVPWILLGVYALLQVMRVWTIASLGAFWTTRIITVDDLPLRRRGPYRLMRHPNYLIVAIEMPLLPCALGLPWLALLFGVLNIALLVYRIRIEDGALGIRRSLNETAPSAVWPGPAR